MHACTLNTQIAMCYRHSTGITSTIKHSFCLSVPISHSRVLDHNYDKMQLQHKNINVHSKGMVVPNRTLFKPHILSVNDVCCIFLYPSNIIIAPHIGFNPISYNYDEDAGVARLTITTNMPLRFTDATGALFYTEDGTATGSRGIAALGVFSVEFRRAISMHERL